MPADETAAPQVVFREKDPQKFKEVDSGVDYLVPPYAIGNKASGGLSDRTAYTDTVHHNGLVEYDTRQYSSPLHYPLPLSSEASILYASQIISSVI